jgi:hypothetical protein
LFDSVWFCSTLTRPNSNAWHFISSTRSPLLHSSGSVQYWYRPGESSLPIAELSPFLQTLSTPRPRGEVGLLPSFTQKGRFQRGIRLRRSCHQSSLVSVLSSHRPVPSRFAGDFSSDTPQPAIATFEERFLPPSVGRRSPPPFPHLLCPPSLST